MSVVGGSVSETAEDEASFWRRWVESVFVVCALALPDLESDCRLLLPPMDEDEFDRVGAGAGAAAVVVRRDDDTADAFAEKDMIGEGGQRPKDSSEAYAGLARFDVFSLIFEIRYGNRSSEQNLVASADVVPSEGSTGCRGCLTLGSPACDQQEGKNDHRVQATSFEAVSGSPVTIERGMMSSEILLSGASPV